MRQYRTKERTKEIVSTIMKKINDKELREHEKLLSEKQLSIKYGVSRIVATRVYKELIKLGAVYSVQRHGYFVAPNSPNIVRTLVEEYKITRMEDKIELIPFTKFMELKHLSNNYFSFSRNYFRDNQLIIQSQNGIDLRIKYEPNVTVLQKNYDSFSIASTVTFLIFEEVEAFNQKLNLVNYRISYSTDGKIVWLSRYIVNPKYFHHSAQQFNF